MRSYAADFQVYAIADKEEGLRIGVVVARLRCARVHSSTIYHVKAGTLTSKLLNKSTSFTLLFPAPDRFVTNNMSLNR